MAGKDLPVGLYNTDTKKQEELDDITTCCICTEVYTDPKALPCIHTFCMKCIQETGLKTNKGPGDEMPCPICRRLFKIPAEGFSGLPKNFFIERLIQMSTVSDSSSAASELCSLCLEESKEQEGKETPTADTYCVDCKYKLCEECCSEHKKFKATKNHKLIPMAEYESSQNLTTNLFPIICEVHEQQVLNIFCHNCKTVVCAICFIEEHKNHDGSHVNKCVDGFRKQIENNTETMNECIAQAKVKKTEIVKVKEEMQQRVESLESDVERRKEEIKKFADKHASCLLQDLCSERDSRLKEIQIATDDTDAYILNLESYNSYCQRILDKGSASDICCALSDLSVRAIELQQACQPVIERDIPDFRFSFSHSELEDGGNLVGKIEGEQRRRLDPVFVQTIRQKVAEDKKKEIRGLTILDKELFVVHCESSEVEVYDSIQLSFSRQWKLKELINPWDIASCIGSKCLYISDYSNMSNTILRVDPNGNKIKNWSTGDDYGRLYVTDELTLILTVYSTNTLNEYSLDGQLIREIDLSSTAGIRSPLHAIKLTNGNFVVSHCDYGGDLHRVCIVDGDGTLKKSFGGKGGSTFGQLNRPLYLSVDADGFVMVADQMNQRVLLLDPELKFKREILSKHGLRLPRRILLDETNNRLFVADNESNNRRILVFDF